MKKITLTHGQVAIVDDDDYELLLPFKWYAMRVKQKKEKWYAKRLSRIDGKILNVYMHREIMGDHHPSIDHIDGDGLNNTRKNLRPCSHSLNCANADKQPSVSGYRGVSWREDRQKFVAIIAVSGKRKRLGSFDDPIEAAKVRDAFVAELYGDFAVLNFPAGGRS